MFEVAGAVNVVQTRRATAKDVNIEKFILCEGIGEVEPPLET